MASSLDRLKSQLLTSGVQQDNIALFQVINQLIDHLKDNINTVEDIIGTPSGVPGIPPVGILGATYLTKNLETGLLPNSKQLIAGSGIQFNDAGNRRVISTNLPIGMDGIDGEDGPPGPPGRIGIDGIQGKDGIAMLAIDGEDGVDGEPGSIGPQGNAGTKGDIGFSGTPGLDGEQGEIGEWGIQGPQGPQGLTGGNSGVRFWFDITDASDIAGYKKALTNPSHNAEATNVQVCAGVGNNLLYSFVTEPGVPGVYWIQDGAAFRHIHCAVTTVGGFARYLVETYYCNADGTGETLVGSSYSNPTTDTSIDEVNWDLYKINAIAILPTQRLVWKLYVARVSGPANVSVTTYFEGLVHPSYVESTISGGATGPPGPMGMTGPSVTGPPYIEPEEPEIPIYLPGPIGPRGPAGMNILKTTGDQTINGGAATYVDITDLTFPVVNGVDYAFYFYITFRSATATTGWKASVNGPAGTYDHWTTTQTVANAATAAATHTHKHNVGTDEMTLLTATVTINVDLAVMIQGRYKCTANGTFAARFANELAANTDIVVQKGSWGFYF